ncbi:zinc finger BED domain-containing protein DAYSLEEPER-like isoform X1 [Amaranthus tricolor]|uniref:zinc finger BED domain-containing protein DAYSLEEPER-like isoform X1 n=1 Tax=Amaranthus tricolor TaxID=29722 RepID=UPI00258B5B50|nr:zinc finger BED domain-containing protein DAYSLEEPER-like isoform X1 [Amaranthus tricolor]
MTGLLYIVNYPTANLYFKSVWRIEYLLIQYADSEDEFLKDMAKNMKNKFDKYWENYSVLSFAAMMDPRYKFQLIKYCFEHLDPQNGSWKANQVKDKLYDLFAEYVRNDTPYGHEASSNVVDDDLPGFSSFAGGTSGNLSQFDIYLEESRLDHHLELDVLQWWKTNETRHAQVERMARDLLAIPITTVASESAFSLGGRVLTKYRVSLQLDTAEALITSRSWLFGYKVKEDPLENGLEVDLQPMCNEEANKDLEDEDEKEDEGEEENQNKDEVFEQFEPAPTRVLLTEAITGSLRKLKACCTLARDRFKSLEKRGIIVPSAKSNRK